MHQWEDLSSKYNELYDELKSLDIRTGLKKLLNITEPDTMRYDLMDWDSYGEQQFLDPDSSIERMKRKIDNYQSKWDMEEYESSF